jgi:Nif-specific regulatory protein
LADGGTIFLDEIGEMPLSLQAKMLRVLQEKQFERVGGTKTFSVDVRIIAVTNVNLENEVNRCRFRADLYYRLNVVPIMLLSLRERTEDIPLLLNHFLSKSNERNNRQIRITADLPATFTLPDPGGSSPTTPVQPAAPPAVSPLTGKSLEEIERAEVKAALHRNGWVQVRAARELGLTQRQIGYRIKKYRLSRYDSFR